MKSDLKHVYEIYVRTAPDKLWQAITSPEWTKKYFYDTAVESDWKKGSRIVYREADGEIALDGTILECTPPKRFVATFIMVHNADAKDDRPSKVTWEIEKRGTTCKLTLTHEDFDRETVTYREVRSGWNPVLSGLKTLLETGEPLAIGQPG